MCNLYSLTKGQQAIRADSSPKVTHWFALGEDRPLFAFAGIWCEWTGVRRKEEGTHQLFGFLTCEANGEVRPIKPVILTTEDEMITWLTAPLDKALRLQRPLPAGALQIVAKGERQDSGGQLAAKRGHHARGRIAIY